MSWLRSKPASATGKPATRRAHSIRFLEREWERIEAYAEERGLTPSEFVRYAVLGAVEGGDRASVAKLAPLIETMFRGTYILTSKLTDDMLEAGHKEVLGVLIAEARKAQEELLCGTSDKE